MLPQTLPIFNVCVEKSVIVLMRFPFEVIHCFFFFHNNFQNSVMLDFWHFTYMACRILFCFCFFFFDHGSLGFYIPHLSIFMLNSFAKPAVFSAVTSVNRVF